jgi:hypothetical protein
MDTRDDDRPTGPDETEAGGKPPEMHCPRCGAAVDADAEFCTKCGAPLGRKSSKAARKAWKHRIPIDVEPWAVKASEAAGRVPRWIKIGVPVAILVIIAVIVALSVVAAGHTPQAAVERYLETLRKADYSEAFEMLESPGGKFGTKEFFTQWQILQVENLGSLRSFSARERKYRNRFFGRLLEPNPEEGSIYVCTLAYRKKTYDVNVTVVDDGGSWPVNSYKLKLAEGPTRAVVAPLGARVFVDGVYAGRSAEDEDLKEALSLKDFPDDLSEAVDYVKKLLRAVDKSVLDAKSFLRNLDKVAEDVQNTLERLQVSGISWQQVVDAWEQVVSESKSFAAEVVRMVKNIYWIFGGGDDGSVRARYTRVQSGLELQNLPEGWHEIRVQMPGMVPDTKEFYAPETATLSLDPTNATEAELKNMLQTYFGVRSNAYFTANPAGLSDVAAGSQLEDDLARVADLAARGLRQSSDLLKLEYVEFKVLSPRVATVETKEAWNYVIYSGQDPVSIVSNQKNDVVYTLRREGGGPWKVIESKTE